MIVLNRVRILYRKKQVIHNLSSLTGFHKEDEPLKEVVYTLNSFVQLESVDGLTYDKLLELSPGLKKFIERGFSDREIYFLSPEITVSIHCKGR